MCVDLHLGGSDWLPACCGIVPLSLCTIFLASNKAPVAHAHVCRNTCNVSFRCIAFTLYRRHTTPPPINSHKHKYPTQKKTFRTALTTQFKSKCLVSVLFASAAPSLWLKGMSDDDSRSPHLYRTRHGTHPSISHNVFNILVCASWC